VLAVDHDAWLTSGQVDSRRRPGRHREPYRQLAVAERPGDPQTGLGQDLARYGIEFTFGDICARPGLTLAQRELLTIAALVAIGGLEPQLRGHTRGALNVDCTPTEMLETVIQTAQYPGFPRALNAIRVVTDTLPENGAEIPAALGSDT
jgi:4-carboxymuconolactone decarboxylase